MPLLDPDPTLRCPHWACQPEGPVEDPGSVSGRVQGSVMTLSPTARTPQACDTFQVLARKSAAGAEGSTFGEGLYRIRRGGCSSDTEVLAEASITGFPDEVAFSIDLSALGSLETLCLTRDDLGEAAWNSDLLAVERFCVDQPPPPLPLPSPREGGPIRTEPWVKECDPPGHVFERQTRFGGVIEHTLYYCHPWPEAMIRFRPIPGGLFTPGSPPDEVGRIAGVEDRGRVHPVAPFLMSQYEVPFRLWEVLGHHTDPALICRTRDCPVVNVSWWAALAFTNQLSLAAGLAPCYHLSGCPDPLDDGACAEAEPVAGCTGYRLPTELEWEWAARADPTGAHYAVRYGPLDTIAWYGRRGPQPLYDIRAPNAFGLYTLIGNVWEWTGDGHPVHHGDGQTPLCAHPQGRAVRGGGYLTEAPERLRAAFRGCWPRDPRDHDDPLIARDIGFRLVRPL